MATIRTSPRAIIRRGDLYLVVHYLDQSGDWFTFPGGSQQHSEDLHQSLEREIEEEIGIKPSIGNIRFIRECIAARNGVRNLPADFHQVEIYFDCSIGVEPLSSGLTPDPNQIGVEWRRVSDLLNLRFFPKSILGPLDDSKVKYLGVC